MEDKNLLDLIIEITIKEKLGYMKYIIDYLINKYNSSNKKELSLPFNINISNSKYLIKIIGLYIYLRKNLKYSILIFDKNGNDPFMKSIIKNNFDFILDVLLKEEIDERFLNLVNKEGKSLIHLIVESKIINKQQILLKILDKRFSFNIKDNKGFCPIDYAYFNHEKKIFEILKNQYFKEGLPLKLNLLYNFYKDSDLLYRESILVSSKYQQCDDLYGLVYDKYKNSSNNSYKVCIDNNSIPYSTFLLRGNVYYYNCIIIKHVLQIIENLDTKKFIVIFSKKDSFDEFIYNNFQEAENKFKDIFKEKTNNNWDEVKGDKTRFKTNYINYYYFDSDFSQEMDIFEYLKITVNNLIIKKKLKNDKNYKIRDLIYYLARKAYNNRFNKDNDTKEVIKNYKNRSIQDSIYILNQIKNLIEKKELNESEKREKAYLLNCYLELIPYSVHKMDTNLFNTVKEINEEIGRLTTFYFIENILKIFLGAIKNLDEMHPLDYIINSLGCNIIELKEQTKEKKYIENFLINTGAKSIKNIFKITESINDINFNPNNFEKRYIFFHGTKSENLIGIISEGLKVSPAQAKFTGNSHGDGIYLSDSYNVSIQYTEDITKPKKYRKKYDDDEEDRKFILLVEAALGKNEEDYKTKNKDIFDNEVYMTEDGYGIFKFDYYSARNGIIVVKNAMNVRVKYIVEI